MTKMNHKKRPVVLCISGFDPVGGAGLQADIETVCACGGRPACALACNTIQSGSTISSWEAVSERYLQEQIQIIFAEFDVSMVKTGMLGPHAETVSKTLLAVPYVPLVIDPIIKAGTGQKLATTDGIDALKKYLLPLASLATPNREEALALAPGSRDVGTAAQILLNMGCKAILVSSAESSDTELFHHLYQANSPVEIFHSRRHQHNYHGSGCTLASAVATYMACGKSLATAVRKALNFTHAAIHHAVKSKKGTWLPDRC